MSLLTLVEVPTTLHNHLLPLREREIEMPKFRLLVTDLTEFGTLRCVAGWDMDREKMIRPEPHPGGFWEQSTCGKGKLFAPGNIVTFEADLPEPKTELPHLNEDRVVQGRIDLSKTLSADEFSSALETMKTVDGATAFGAPVRVNNRKAFVPTGTNHPSLVGLAVGNDQISFSTEKFGDKPAKPRLLLNLPDRSQLNLSVAACDLRELFRSRGAIGLQKLFSVKKRLHIRLGLARGFSPFPDRCYMQVNGIYVLK